jgi:hypothetical protein
MRFLLPRGSEVYELFWATTAGREFITDAAARMARIARAPGVGRGRWGFGRGAAVP